MTANVDRNRRWWLRRWLNRLEVDRAVFYSVSARAWQFVAGPVTILLIAFHFTPELQGYFYTFASLLALQTFVELGLQVVIINVSSHEWAKLSLDDRGQLTGEQAALSRLVSLGRKVAVWYAAASLVFVAGVGAAGVAFFWPKVLPPQQWMLPWLALVGLTGLLLWTLPFVAILEGCNQVITVNKYRFTQAVAGNLAVWACIAAGAGLWAAVASAAVKLAWEVYLLRVRYRAFFRPFFAAARDEQVCWRTEIWPLQWTLAVQGVLQYFAFFLFTPITLQYHGAAAAGQMGMTWSVLTALQAGAFAWVHTRTPLFGMLISRRDYRELDRVFKRVSIISGCILTLAGLSFCAVVVLLNQASHPLAAKLASRFLPPLPTIVFTTAVVLYYIPQCMAPYLLAHKRNPMLLAAIVGNSLIGAAVCVFGAKFGPLGAGLGLLAVVAAFVVPVLSAIWWRCRRQWHRDGDDACITRP
jgi:hypothetical protein